MIAVKTPSIAAAEETRRGEKWREEKRREEKRREPELDRTCSSRDSCIQRGRGEIDSPNLRKDEDEDEDGHIELQLQGVRANFRLRNQLKCRTLFSLPYAGHSSHASPKMVYSPVVFTSKAAGVESVVAFSTDIGQ
ncbi:hypothetical protein AXG93_3384s2040 [Marchantia polymorpha subsp. ruderalis]|uniref:Uncharacterized protein n=1 Tax=Marchantia polymorpha subsp. ruderalis TaxID=1480154 RepID=A0A176WEQ4_MARPO|nr:hypothetical protein AXG93_3384s2040 [Marchantia polymorpha subsp. ruderalis]